MTTKSPFPVHAAYDDLVARGALMADPAQSEAASALDRVLADLMAARPKKRFGLFDKPRPVRGLEFRRYISLQRGMTEGELLGVAGEPDFRTRDRSVRTYTYMPTPADPFTTTITLVGGRIGEIERVRKF